ncbi:hypothetical protein C5167_039633 [Papaver somniferum]|uniref:Uncharacterized protein n=1 Tax=Papaver somniferum TaxID=3469 RepID=A0A4Y7ICN2_PAPSO|nr:hypothetical protein C5167_039633 [Papaver somniferum]
MLQIHNIKLGIFLLQLAIQRAMNRDRQRICRKNLTEEQRSTVTEQSSRGRRIARTLYSLLSIEIGSLGEWDKVYPKN